MSDSEVSESDIYLQSQVVFESGKKYLVKAKSGHGKTSLLNFIYGNSFCFDGVISFNENFTDIFALRRDKLSYVFQELCLFSNLTAVENVQIKNRLTNYKSEAEIDEMLGKLIPIEKKSHLISQLSLGQQQRVAIVRALCQPFDFLLLDEPFSHLDRETAIAAAQLITNEVDSQNAGMIVTALDDTTVLAFDKVLNL